MGLLESATLGYTGQTLGLTIWDQFLGWRFHLTSSSKITALGGHLGADFTGNGLFAAIIKLPSPNGLPSFHPRTIESSPDTLAHTRLVPTSPSSDILVPLGPPLILQPGTYGLVFGGADSAVNYFPFWATGTGVMPTDNHDCPGSSYFMGDTFRWSDLLSPQNLRFSIEIDPTPPSPPTGLKIS